MNVLSLFDGMSCGQQALERIGIKVDNYFASEIDKYAIQVTMANYSNTIQLGSVINIDGYSLPKIDLLIGGSPCQSFSFAGKRKGMATKDEQEILTLEHYLQLKSEGFEFEWQSYLFWEYMRLLNEVKPKYFLLENVEMGEKWEKVLSSAIGVNGIHINSALVSAQNRKRIYWTNIGMISGGLFGDPISTIKQPKDKGILLKDILEKEVNEKYFLSEKMIIGMMAHAERHEEKGTGFAWNPTFGDKKASCLRANAALAPTDNIIKIDKKGNIKLDQNKASCFTAGGNSGGNHSDMDLIVHNTMPRSSTTGKGGTGHLSRSDGKTYCLDTGNTNAIEIRKVIQLSNNNKSNSGTQPYQQDRIYDTNGISPALSAGKSDLMIMIKSQTEKLLEKTGVDISNVIEPTIFDVYNKTLKNDGKCITLTDPCHNNLRLVVPNNAVKTSRIRRLTPIECERLQTVKDNYTNHVSDSQRYRMLGNGWTIDVIAHILSYI